VAFGLSARQLAEEPAEAVEYWLVYDQMKRAALERLETPSRLQPDTAPYVVPLEPEDM
jgi:hypothetical protein